MTTKLRKPRLTNKTMSALITASGFINADAEAMDGDDSQRERRDDLLLAVAWIDKLASWHRSRSLTRHRLS